MRYDNEHAKSLVERSIKVDVTWNLHRFNILLKEHLSVRPSVGTLFSYWRDQYIIDQAISLSPHFKSLYDIYTGGKPRRKSDPVKLSDIVEHPMHHRVIVKEPLIANDYFVLENVGGKGYLLDATYNTKPPFLVRVAIYPRHQHKLKKVEKKEAQVKLKPKEWFIMGVIVFDYEKAIEYARDMVEVQDHNVSIENIDYLD